MSTSAAFVAVDLGASSGRVHLGKLGDSGLEVEEVHRFANGGIDLLGHLHWDVLAIHRGILEGLRRCAEVAEVASIGIDSWAVDYGLLDAGGELIANPYHHRDRRTEGVADAVTARVGAARWYRRNGIAQLGFNTAFQLAADRERAAIAARLLLVPDLMGYWLTSRQVAEITNASTTGLLTTTDDGQPAWDLEVMGEIGIPPGLFAPLILPGETIGGLLGPVAAETGLPAGVPVLAVGSHDTASAVVGVPAGREPFAFLSSGTWSLLGVELDAPVRSEQARLAGFTNELGVDRTVRFLRNVMGLWLLQECLRSWRTTGADQLAGLLAEAGRLPALRFVFDVDDPALLAPGGMPGRIAAACSARGGPVPSGPAETTRCIADSLAVAYRRALDDARRLSGHPVEVVHLVGGGARNELLCQLTANACNLPVVTGPVEAAAAGNLAVQARAHGDISGDLADLRALVGGRLRTYEPTGPDWPWLEAAASLAPAGAPRTALPAS